MPASDSFSQGAIEDAFDVYRKKPQDRATALAALTTKYGNRSVPVEMIGVWDTVGALGVPSLTGGIDTHRFGFLDTRLGAKVRGAYQALALDERRREFPATLWDNVTASGQILEQVWFSGCHGNVGGGCPTSALSDLPLKWMMSKGLAHGLEVSQALQDRLAKVSPACALDSIDDSWGPLWGRPSWRSVPVGAALSASVTARLQGMESYTPGSLLFSGRVLDAAYHITTV